MIDLKQLKNIPRYKDIATILVVHGFEHVAEALGITTLYTKVGRLIRRSQEPEVAVSLARRIRSALEQLGPTFIKLGQILSTRRDLLPEDFIEEFSQLQDSVPPMEYEKVRRVFLAEMGKPPEEVFAHFEQQWL